MLVNSNRDRIAERREATRREILDVAWQLARERGLSQLTLRDIAHRVGMRAPSLYSHFESKNAIYDAMFASAWIELAAVFDAMEPLPEATGAIRTSLHTVRIIYSVASWSGTLRPEVDGTTDAVAWFTPEEVRHLPLAHYVQIVVDRLL